MTEFIITCQSELQKDGSYKIERYRELVRCKDCKHSTVSESGLIKCGHVFRMADFFCADGERRATE